MEKVLAKNINSIIIASIVAFIIGLIMIIFPMASIKTIGIIVAALIILHGIILLYLDARAIKYGIPFDGILAGLLCILMGIFLICKPAVLPIVLTIAVGIWMILVSVNFIKIAIQIRNTTLQWTLLLLLGILDLVAGVLVIFNPFAASISITLFIGIMLIIHAVITIFDMILIKKDIKDITKELNRVLKEASK